MTRTRIASGGKESVSAVWRRALGVWLATACFAAASVARGQVLTWDGNGSTTPNPTGGNGTWNTSLLNWWDGTANVAWPTSGTNNDAVFANTAGTVTISDGVTANDLTFSTANYILTGGTLTLNGSTPTITQSVASTINSALAGTAGLTKAGAGVLTLGGSNSGLAGALSVNAGRLIFNSTAAFGGLTGVTVADGARLQLANGATTGSSVAISVSGNNGTTEGALVSDNGIVNGAVTIANSTVRIGTPAGATGPGLTINGAITAPVASGRGLVVRYGDGGGLILTNTANYWEGNTTVSQGRLYAAPDALPTATALQVGFSGAGWFETNGTFTRALGSGSNQVAFSATNTSGLSARGGDLTVNFGGAGAGVTWGTGSFAGGVLGLNSPTATGRLTLVNPISLNAGARTVQIDSGTAELSGVMSGAAGSSLTKTGSGTLMLSGTNTFSGNVTSSGGYIVATNSSSLGSGAKTFTAQAVGRGLILDGSGGNFTLASDISYTLSNDNSGGLGPGLRNVSGTNTIAGAITNQTGGGGLALQSDAGLLVLSGTISNGASLRDLILDGAGSGIVSGRISGGGNGYNLLKRGAGTWTLTGSNTLPGSQTSGTVSVNTGTLQIGDGGTTGSLNTVGVVTGSAGAVLAFNRSDAFTFATGIDGGLGLTKLGNGTLTLTGTSTFSGATAVNAGTLQLGSGSTAGSINASSMISGSTGGVLGFNRSDDITFANAISGGVGLSKQAAGAVRLTGPISYTGTTTITAGTLDFGLGVGTTTLNGNFVGSSGTLRYSGAGTLVISSTAANLNTFAGPVVVDSGVLQMGASDGNQNRGLRSVTNFTVNAGATLAVTREAINSLAAITVNSGTLTTGSVGGSSGAFQVFGGATTLNAGSIITGAGLASSFQSFALGQTLTVSGTGASQILAGNGANNGMHLVHSGTVGAMRTFAVGDATNSAAADLTVSASLLNSSNNGNAAGLIKAGLGTMLLSGSNAYTGFTTVTGGILDFTTLNALRNTSGVTIAGGAALRYSGAAGTFDRPITVTAGSGTGTVRNSSGGLLTLSGNLSKDNSVLRLTGGAFNVTGTISGTTPGASDLLVDGTSSVTLSAVNTYDGPTFVIESSTLTYGVNNAIPSTSVVNLGNTTSPGTLDMNGFTGEIGGLTFGSGGGTLRLAATSTSAPVLTATAGTMTLANGTLDLAGSGTSAGLYRVLSAQSISGSFASVTGTSAAYQLLTTATNVDYQQRAVLGALTVTSPAVSIITGGSAAFTYSVVNNALAGGAALGFSSGSLSANLAGVSSGSALAGGPSDAISGLVFTGTSIGSSQTGVFSITAPTAFGATTATGTIAVTVLDHALPGFAAAGITDAYTQDTLSIDFGTIDESAGMQSFTYNLLNLASQTDGPGLTAGLDFTAVTADGNGFTSGLTTFNNLVGGGTSSLYTFSFTPTGQGSFNRQFTLSFSDNQNLSGASTRRDLTIVANVIVVPEPGTIVLAVIGVAAAGGFIRHRHKRK